MLLISSCSQDELNYNESNVYLLLDTLDEEFSKFVRDEKNLKQVNDFINKIENHSDIKYHYSYLHPIGIEEYPKNEGFIYLYEDGLELEEFQVGNNTFYNINSVQTDTYAIELNNLTFSQGHGNGFESINVYSSTVPVVLGYNYSDYYQVGDTFNINYLLDNYEAEVIGVLSKEQTLITSNEPDIMLDNYIILPKINVENNDIKHNILDNYNENISHIAKITSQTHAILITNNSKEVLLKQLEKIGAETGFNQYTITDITNQIRD